MGVQAGWESSSGGHPHLKLVFSAAQRHQEWWQEGEKKKQKKLKYHLRGGVNFHHGAKKPGLVFFSPFRTQKGSKLKRKEGSS